MLVDEIFLLKFMFMLLLLLLLLKKLFIRILALAEHILLSQKLIFFNLKK